MIGTTWKMVRSLNYRNKKSVDNYNIPMLKWV